MDSPRDHEPSPSPSSDASAAPVDAEEAEELDSAPQTPKFVFPILLFLATVFTTLWAGAYAPYALSRLGPIDFLHRNPAALLNGIPFAATLLTILITHELGHYILAKIHGIPASFPMFVPGPPQLIGTFGAIIRMRGPIQSRKALFDIGVAGPIAGFLITIPFLFVGISLSGTIASQRTFGYHFGEPLAFQLVTWILKGPIPEGYEIAVHPVAFAGWFGLFITSLNLIPIGQFDGGHVAYALWGNRQRSMAIAAIPILIVLGFLGWPGWFLWAGMAGLVGLSHPPVGDPQNILGSTRIWIGRAAVLIFILSFSPVPISIH